MSRRRNRALHAFVVSLLLLSATAGIGAQTDSDPVRARVYEVHHRSLTDAADLVGELLSEDGSVTLKPHIKTLLVEDRISVLDRVESMLDSFDLPPRRVEVTVSLFLGTREGKELRSRISGGPISEEVRGVMETIGDFTKWTSYEPLGSRAVMGSEGEAVSASISAEYMVAFTVESVHEGESVVKFERFSLQRIQVGEDGSEELEDLYTAGMVVDVGALQLLIAASGPDSERALFLALQAEPR